MIVIILKGPDDREQRVRACFSSFEDPQKVSEASPYLYMHVLLISVCKASRPAAHVAL